MLSLKWLHIKLSVSLTGRSSGHLAKPASSDLHSRWLLKCKKSSLLEEEEEEEEDEEEEEEGEVRWWWGKEVRWSEPLVARRTTGRKLISQRRA